MGSIWAFMKTGNRCADFFQMYREEVYLRGMFKFKGPELSQLVFSFAKKGIQADNLYSYIDEEIVQQGLEHFC